MPDEQKPKIEKAEKPVKELELNQETVADLTEQEGEEVKGGYLMPPPLTRQVVCKR